MSFEVVDVSSVPPAGQAPEASLLIMDPAMLADASHQETLSVPASSAGAEEAPVLADESEDDLSIEPLLAPTFGGNTTGQPSEARGNEFDPALILAEAAADEAEPIVIVGKRHKDEGGSTSYNNGGFWYTYGGGGDSGGGGGGSGTGEIAPPPDEAVIEVAVNFTPTAEQQAVIDRFKEAIAKGVEAVNALPDDAKLTLENGSTVTGAELKAIVAKMDFTINPIGTSYSNGTTLGAADYNGGDPKISFNIDTLQGYDRNTGGLIFAALHEVGHLAAASRNHLAAIHADGFHSPDETDNHEEMASDIARAVASAAGLPVLANPFYGYSSIDALVFETASGGDGGGGGGGGGYGGGGEHVSY